MADSKRSRPLGGYFKQLSLFTSDFLEPSKRKKKAANRGTFYKVERVISRRTADGKVRGSSYHFKLKAHISDFKSIFCSLRKNTLSSGMGIAILAVLGRKRITLQAILCGK